jgi:hypothetical protein
VRAAGRAIAQALSRRLPTAAARVRAKVRSRGICDGQSGSGAGFLRVLRFPLHIFTPLTAPHSSSVIRSWYNKPLGDRSTKWTQSHPTYLLMELRPSSVAANSAAIQEFTSILWNQKVHYRVHKSPPLVPILGQINPNHTIPSYLSKVYFNIVHPPTPWSFQWPLYFWLSHQYRILVGKPEGMRPLGTPRN